MNFKIIHLFYFTAIVAAATALFQSNTLPWVLFASVQWFWISKAAYNRRKNRRTPHPMLIAFFLTTPAVVFVWIYYTQFLPFQFETEDSVRVSTMGIVGYALEDYMATHGSYPPPYIAGENGQPMHSWRVLILPFLGEQEIYDQYNFNEPWNGTNNRQLADKLSKDCALFNSHHSWSTCTTPYKLVTGQGTPFEAGALSNPNALRHGASQQILLVEDNGHATSWMRPTDLSIAQAKTLFDKTKSNNRFVSHNPLINIARNDFYVCTYDLSIFRVGYLDDPNQAEPYFLNDQPRISSLTELPFQFPDATESPNRLAILLLLLNASLAVLPAFHSQLQLFSNYKNTSLAPSESPN